MEILRRNRRSIASQVLALLAVVWLNLALAPCAMSMSSRADDGSSHGVGHAGGEGMGQQTDHPMGEPMSPAQAPCHHCPPNQSSCDTALSSPCALQAQLRDDPAVSGLPAYHPLPFFAAAPAVVEYSPHPVRQSLDRPPGSMLSPPGVALHKRFCVYLK
jgi:hypothetical protein